MAQVGDKPGHPFRGNQYTSHSGQVVVEGTPEDRGVKAAREVVRRVNEKVGYRPEEDLRVQLENARYRREAAATSSQSRVRNTERVRQIRAYDAELSALGGSKVAPDFDHLSRENKIPAKVSDIPAGGRGGFFPVKEEKPLKPGKPAWERAREEAVADSKRGRK